MMRLRSVRLPEVHARVQLERQGNRAAVAWAKLNKMGFRWLQETEIEPRFGEIDPIPFQDFRHAQPIDRAEAIQAMNTGHDALVFDVGQTAQPDREVRVLVPLGDQIRCFLDLPVTEPEPLTSILQSQTSLHVFVVRPIGPADGAHNYTGSHKPVRLRPTTD